jgi:hypothetical protein
METGEKAAGRSRNGRQASGDGETSHRTQRATQTRAIAGVTHRGDEAEALPVEVSAELVPVG